MGVSPSTCVHLADRHLECALSCDAYGSGVDPKATGSTSSARRKFWITRKIRYCHGGVVAVGIVLLTASLGWMWGSKRRPRLPRRRIVPMIAIVEPADNDGDDDGVDSFVLVLGDVDSDRCRFGAVCPSRRAKRFFLFWSPVSPKYARIAIRVCSTALGRVWLALFLNPAAWIYPPYLPAKQNTES